MLPIYGEMHSTVSVMRQMQFAELQQAQQQQQQQQLATTFSYDITLFVCASCSWYACVCVCRVYLGCRMCVWQVSSLEQTHMHQTNSIAFLAKAAAA